jgi:hypothetical protein
MERTLIFLVWFASGLLGAVIAQRIDKRPVKLGWYNFWVAFWVAFGLTIFREILLWSQSH